MLLQEAEYMRRQIFSLFGLIKVDDGEGEAYEMIRNIKGRFFCKILVSLPDPPDTGSKSFYLV